MVDTLVMERDVLDGYFARELLKFSVKEDESLRYQRMGTMYTWLMKHGSLEHGTVLEAIKLYCDNELVAYAVFESYEHRSDKVITVDGESYRDLGMVHFRTKPECRGRGYATMLADALYTDVISPLLAQHEKNSFVMATGDAIQLMKRSGMDMNRLSTSFYSDVSFKEKVLDVWNGK